MLPAGAASVVLAVVLLLAAPAGSTGADACSLSCGTRRRGGRAEAGRPTTAASTTTSTTVTTQQTWCVGVGDSACACRSPPPQSPHPHPHTRARLAPCLERPAPPITLTPTLCRAAPRRTAALVTSDCMYADPLPADPMQPNRRCAHGLRPAGTAWPDPDTACSGAPARALPALLHARCRHESTRAAV